MKTLFLAGKQIAIFLLKYINNQAFRPSRNQTLILFMQGTKSCTQFLPLPKCVSTTLIAFHADNSLISYPDSIKQIIPINIVPNK
jgi:hypothetical protein